jgi:hypothetical protein
MSREEFPTKNSGTLVVESNTNKTAVIDIKKTESKSEKKKLNIEVPIIKKESPINNSASPENIKNVNSTQERFIVQYLEEELDPEWGYEYAEQIQNELYELLNEKNAWIENVECKKTLCKLNISAAPDSGSIGRTAADILSKLSSTKWHKGSLRLAKLNSSNGSPSLEILVGRYKDTFK